MEHFPIILRVVSLIVVSEIRGSRREVCFQKCVIAVTANCDDFMGSVVLANEIFPAERGC